MLLLPVAVVVTFFLCWAPFHAQRIMAVYGKIMEKSFSSDDLFMRVYIVLTYISGISYFLSTCINPFLYNIMSHKFRNASKVSQHWYFNWFSRLSSLVDVVPDFSSSNLLDFFAIFQPWDFITRRWWMTSYLLSIFTPVKPQLLICLAKPQGHAIFWKQSFSNHEYKDYLREFSRTSQINAMF